jgi:hypothetical protein
MKLCSLYQIVIKWREGENLPASATRHIQTCPECKQTERDCLLLAKALSSQKLEPQVSPFLARRILANLPRQTSAGLALAWRRSLGYGVGAGVCAAVLMLALRPVSPPQTDSPRHENASLELPAIPAVPQIAKSLNDPLEGEIQRVIEDTRNAWQHVASNFLPTEGGTSFLGQ